MIKEILEQLAPLDAQIAALKGSGNDMEAITAHASELAELAVEEDEILRSCGPLTGSAAIYGQAVVNGAELAVEEINASDSTVKFTFLKQDDEADGEKALNAYNTMMDEAISVQPLSE